MSLDRTGAANPKECPSDKRRASLLHTKSRLLDRSMATSERTKGVARSHLSIAYMGIVLFVLHPERDRVNEKSTVTEALLRQVV